jgi:hypothetical protein
LTQDSENYWRATAAAAEVYNLATCNDFPVPRVNYSGITVYDANYNVEPSPNWYANYQWGATPWCQFEATFTATTASLRHEPQQPPPPEYFVMINGPRDAQVGCPTEWQAVAENGSAPYVYSWRINGAPYKNGGSDIVDYTPTSAGTLSLQVTSTDANGAQRNAALDVNVYQGPCT